MGSTSGKLEAREQQAGTQRPECAGDESLVSAGGARLREVSYFLYLPGSAAEPPAAHPEEVTAGAAAEGGRRNVGGGVWGSRAQATFRCDSFANLHNFNIKST